jgi:hypothetical protein
MYIDLLLPPSGDFGSSCSRIILSLIIVPQLTPYWYILQSIPRTCSLVVIVILHSKYYDSAEHTPYLHDGGWYSDPAFRSHHHGHFFCHSSVRDPKLHSLFV